MAGWSGYYHITPDDDLIEHENRSDCVCNPSEEEITSSSGRPGWIYMHHSLDGRELNEPDFTPTTIKESTMSDVFPDGIPEEIPPVEEPTPDPVPEPEPEPELPEEPPIDHTLPPGYCHLQRVAWWSDKCKDVTVEYEAEFTHLGCKHLLTVHEEIVVYRLEDGSLQPVGTDPSTAPEGPWTMQIVNRCQTCVEIAALQNQIDALKVFQDREPSSVLIGSFDHAGVSYQLNFVTAESTYVIFDVSSFPDPPAIVAAFLGPEDRDPSTKELLDMAIEVIIDHLANNPEGATE